MNGIIIYFLIINFVAFIMLAKDLSNSMVGGSRFSTKQFLVVAILGGTPSLIIGPMMLKRSSVRHEIWVYIIVLVFQLMMKDNILSMFSTMN